MRCRRRRSVAFVAVAAATATAGCAVFGGSAEEGRPESPVIEQEGEAAGASTDSAAARGETRPSMEERMLAGDYEGVLAAYGADSTLHEREEPVYRAGIAAAMPGHAGHDPFRAARLFQRLLERHPDSAHRAEAELYLDLLARERELRATVERLDRELRQLKAIDLGREPAGEP